MKKVCKRFGVIAVLMGIMLFAAGFTFHATTVETQAAAKTGFRVKNGKTYYYLKGKKQTGWIKVKGRKYYLNAKGVVQKGWMKNADGTKCYFNKKTGSMYKYFQKVGRKYYYFDPKTGATQSGFIKCQDGKTRYFSPKKFTMATGWMTNKEGQKWYFNKKNGVMYTGWKKIGKYYYLFNKRTGVAFRGFSKGSNGLVRYYRKNYKMATGWLTERPSGLKRYFSKKGVMYTGLKKVSGRKYYFDPDTGLWKSGFVTINNNKYYFDPDTHVMVTGTRTIDNIKYVFNSRGVMTSATNVSAVKAVYTTSASERTIKNFLAGALQPVGSTLYIWGGGHNYSDSVRKGVSSAWKSFYSSQGGNYNYKSNGLNNLSATNEAKGLDCSGFVGWSVYQVLQTASGGTCYTEVSGDIGSSYRSKGLGSILNQAYLAKTGWKVCPGDIGYDDGHTWIILGQCSDLSAVVLHSTPNAGVQISGTPTPGGAYNSQAVALAKQYMSKYAGYKKFDYHTSCGNYIRRGNYFRWNTTLSDPNGYKNMTADQILADLFS